MRGTAQGLCLLFGLGGMIAYNPVNFIKRDWPLWGYLLAIFIFECINIHIISVPLLDVPSELTWQQAH
jgi:hypothetical protein